MPDDLAIDPNSPKKEIQGHDIWWPFFKIRRRLDNRSVHCDRLISIKAVDAVNYSCKIDSYTMIEWQRKQ